MKQTTIVRRIVRMFAEADVSYQQSKHIIEAARKELGLKPPKSKSGTVKRLFQSDVDKFLQAAYRKNALTGLMMTTLYETAARVDEFVNFKASDFHHDEATLVIEAGKGNKRRELPLTAPLNTNLLIHLNGRDFGPLFRSQRGGQYSTRRIQDITKETAIAADIIHVHPHLLRHTRATILAENGMSIELLSEFLGHDSVKTTEIYLRTAGRNLRKGYDAATNYE